MALMEIRLTIVRILEKYDLEKDGEPGATLNIKGIVSIPQNLFTVKFNLK